MGIMHPSVLYQDCAFTLTHCRRQQNRRTRIVSTVGRWPSECCGSDPCCPLRQDHRHTRHDSRWLPNFRVVLRAAHRTYVVIGTAVIWSQIKNWLIKSLSQRKPCKIVHKQGWPILIIFGGLEGLCTSISNILYFLSEIQNGRRTGRHLDFPILGLKCPWKYQKIDAFYAFIF